MTSVGVCVCVCVCGHLITCRHHTAVAVHPTFPEDFLEGPCATRGGAYGGALPESCWGIPGGCGSFAGLLARLTPMCEECGPSPHRSSCAIYHYE